MPIELIRKSQQNCATWSGGTTTQLFIYPRNETYSNLQFDFRISTATVEVETSTFTQLPGVRRTLMVLDGTMELSHQHHHTKQLQRFDLDEFMGDWQTNSIGKCTDLNLMCRGTSTGQIFGHSLASNTTQTCTIPPNSMNFLYCVSGELTISIHSSAADTNNFTETITTNDFLVIEDKYCTEITLKASKPSDFVLIHVDI
ncbi:MAG: HutD family protein [Crocinitomix sp.]|nr:HutD family protein [Crocinitomix sp.]